MKKFMFAFASLCILIGTCAHADLVFDASGVVGGRFNYTLSFSANNDALTGLATERLQPGDYATLYDLPGLTSAVLSPTYSSDFTLTLQSIGVTPPGTAPDDTSLQNATLTYKGGVSASNLNFTDVLTVNSIFTFQNPNGEFTSLVTKNVGPNAGTGISEYGNVMIPGTATLTATPEPGILALFSTSLLASGIVLWRKRR